MTAQQSDPPMSQEDMSPRTKVYEGNPLTSREAFEKDAPRFAALHFYPVSREFQLGKFTASRWLVAAGEAVVVALVLWLIMPLWASAFFSFMAFLLFLLLIKPKGTLTVQYVYHPPATVEPAPMKSCPKCAEHVKEEAVVCRFCNHDFSDMSASEAIVSGGAGEPA